VQDVTVNESFNVVDLAIPGTERILSSREHVEAAAAEKESLRQRMLEHRQGREVLYRQRLDDIREQLKGDPNNDRLLRKENAYKRKLDSWSEELEERKLEHFLIRQEFLEE